MTVRLEAPPVDRGRPSRSGRRGWPRPRLRVAAALALVALPGCGAAQSAPDAARDAAHDATRDETPAPSARPTRPTTAAAPGRPAPPSPSTGCNGEMPPTGEQTIAAGTQPTPYLVTLPEGYDGQKPFPLVFALHGRTRSHRLMRDVDSSRIQEELGSRAVMVYLKSSGVGWSQRDEREQSLASFEALYPRLLATYCVDAERTFAVGHSSGGFFAHFLACKHPERLRGIAAIAGPPHDGLACGRTAALLIHGQRDQVVSPSRGRQALERTLRANRCSAETEPMGVEGCVRYRGCDEGFPVAWCEHDEPTYQDTNHGWPSFASAAVASFFESLGRTPLPGGDNLLSSADFEGSSGSWQATFASDRVGARSERAGAFCGTLQSKGENPWDAQLLHAGLRLEPGKRYRLDYRAWATAATEARSKVGLNSPPWREFWVQTRTLGPEKTRVVEEFVLAEPPGGESAFAVQFAGPLVGALPVTVCLDDVWLSEVPEGG